MIEYKQPLSVYFVYHPNALKNVIDAVEYCYKNLQRDSDKPFSRFINIPVFYNTSLSEDKLPQAIDSNSEKTIVFLLIDDNVVINKSWTDYYNKIYKNKKYITIPVAITNNAFNIKNMSNYQFIRAFEFEKRYYKENFIISVTHEIYRFVFNKFKKVKYGKEKSVCVFLSHTKVDHIGCTIAEQIKDFILNTTMNNFFDKTCITTNDKFDNEICKYIKTSTLLVINSDPYSSRYWCQKEVLCAKENERPIIALDCLNKYEDRRFPHASNIATIHLESKYSKDIPRKILYNIIIAILLETLRQCYSKLLLECYKKAEIIPSESIILSRPPEFIDVCKFTNKSDDDKVEICSNTPIFYPEPLLYDTEMGIFEKLGIKINTPINYNFNSDFTNVNIGISISNPEQDNLMEIGQYDNHLIQLSQDLARHLIARNANLIYGGDLREGGFTEFIFNEAKILNEKLKRKSKHIKNYIAYPIHKNDSQKEKDWKAKYINIAKMVECKYPKDISDLIETKLPSKKTYIINDIIKNSYIFSRCLTDMRKKMIKKCTYRIAAGGKHKNYKGIMPGVLEEILIAKKYNKPLYLLGGFGGVTASVCKIIKTSKPVEKLTLKWQIENNTNYKELLDYTKERKQKLYNYEDLTNILNWDIVKDNGLTEKENELLFETPFVDEAVYLIMKGLANVY